MTTKEQAYNNLVDCKEIMDRLGIPFILWGGTMLGAYRNGDLIPYDEDDIDIRIDEKYADRFEEMVREFVKVGFVKKRTYKYNGVWIGGSVKRGNNHIDIGFFFRKRDEVYVLRRSKTDKRRYEASVYPRHFFEKFEKAKLGNFEMLVPQDTEKFLEIRYGKNWNIPRLRPKWRASEVKSIRDNYDF